MFVTVIQVRRGRSQWLIMSQSKFPLTQFPLINIQLCVKRVIFLIYKWLRCKYFDIRPCTWWKYAGNATLHTIKERNKKLTKKFLVQRARDVCAYYRVYSNYLETHVLNAENTVSVHDRQLY